MDTIEVKLVLKNGINLEDINYLEKKLIKCKVKKDIDFVMSLK